MGLVEELGFNFTPNPQELEELDEYQKKLRWVRRYQGPRCYECGKIEPIYCFTKVLKGEVWFSEWYCAGHITELKMKVLDSIDQGTKIMVEKVGA